MSVQSLFSLCFRWIAIICAALAAILAIRTALFIANSSTAAATVSGYREVRNYAPFGLFSPEESARYFVELVYRPERSAQQYTVVSARGASEQQYAVGESIEIRYSNRRPAYARLNTRAGLWGSTAIFALLTAIFGALGAIAPFAFRLGNQKDSSTTR